MTTSRTARTLLIGAFAGTACVLLPAGTAIAASPNPAASCVAALSQGATPHGISESAPGFLGQFVAAEATSAPGVVGTGSSTAAQQHGGLFDCLPQ